MATKDEASKAPAARSSRSRSRRKKIMVTGVGGGLARLVAVRMLGHGEVIGVDPRPRSPHLPPEIEFFRADYAKSRMLDLFRQHEFDAVIHLGRRGIRGSTSRRFDVNVIGTEKILAACEQHGVKQVVLMSTFHVYGAHPFNPTPITEDHPLRASQSIPELADAVLVDNAASTWMYRHPKRNLTVLRPVNIVGPNLNNAMCRFFRNAFVPYLAGFDPMVQFIHEWDMTTAIELAYTGKLRGIYNVTGGSPVPFQEAIRFAGSTPVPIPHLLAYPAVDLLSRFRLTFPPHLMDFFRYPCVISSEKFESETDFDPTRDVKMTMRSIRR